MPIDVGTASLTVEFDRLHFPLLVSSGSQSIRRETVGLTTDLTKSLSRKDVYFAKSQLVP